MADVPLTDDTPKPPRAPWPDGVGWDTYDDAWQDGWETGYKAAPSVAHQTDTVLQLQATMLELQTARDEIERYRAALGRLGHVSLDTAAVRHLARRALEDKP